MRWRLGGIGDALADRNFRIYTVGSITSWISFFVQVVAVSWTAWELTHSTTWLAIIALLDIAPNVLLVPLASTLADRMDRFRIVIVSYALALVQALALTVLAYAGWLTIWPLAVLVLLHGAIHSFSVPAAYGMLPRFVARERLASAIAVNSAYNQAAIVAGPALAGWLILHHGVAIAFAANVLGYLVYLISAAFLRTPVDFKQPPKSGRSVMGDLTDGARYIFGHQGISTLLILMLLGDVLAVSLYHMLPAFSAETLGRGVEGMSAILTAYGVGATLAALWLAHGGSARVSPIIVLRAFAIYACAIGGLILMGNLWLAAGAALLWGIAGQIRSTGTIALLQTSIPDEQRGRVMGTEFLFSRIAGGIGTYLVGSVAERQGLELPMLSVVALCLAAWGWAYAKRNRIGAAFEPAAARVSPPAP
ncbi:MFS transporter [Dongia deserti]|uniref:MFS transporter n=1 Tax=Dongia deserti TaxID=2268030 RepID=UPI000E65E7C1|nr:MFS transporter [Dongia deserti]